MHDVMTVYNARALVSAHVCYIHAVVSLKSWLHSYGAHAAIKEVLWQLATPISHTVLYKDSCSDATIIALQQQLYSGYTNFGEGILY